jgi:hypothetical protein
MQSEVAKLLADGKISKSNSPWRAQPLVVNKNDSAGKKRMVIDFSSTINKFTHLDSYPLPRINDIVNQVAKFKVVSKLDLKSAYHQIPLHPDDRPLTAFQVGNELYHWNVLPLGITNAVPCFQRIANDFVERHNLKEHVFPYLDDWGVGGNSKEEHDYYLALTLKAAKEEGFVLNDSKCIFNQSTIPLLGHVVGNGTIKPDPERVKALLDIEIPTNKKALQRVIGIFAYYAKWLLNYSDRIRPLIDSTEFPISAKAVHAFNDLKNDLAKVSLHPIDEHVPFVVETDASDVALSGILNQNGRPVVFHSRTFNESERRLHSVEKEALAIVDTVRKYKHLLSSTHFTIITDQRSVSFIFDVKHSNKIKNEKLARWRLELSSLSFDVLYRPGPQNKGADALSRAFCASTCALMPNVNLLNKLHVDLCHPGVERMFHFVKTKNLPYSVDNVKTIVNSCNQCARTKPRFFTARSHDNHLIKALHCLDRLNIDFKGPLPSVSKNRYLLTVVDEYSRFMWAYACPDMESKTVIKCLTQMFTIFGMPNYVHSDQGPSLISEELKIFLHERGVATSRTNRYNPRGNGQIERYNGVLWRKITSTLMSRGLRDSHWESVLPDALHSQRSLLCKATNTTPHERMFTFPRKSSSGYSIPSWLKPGPVLVKRHVRNKYDPLVDDAELLEINPSYGTVRLDDGREINVSLRDLAPAASQNTPMIDQGSPETLLPSSGIEVAVPEPSEIPGISIVNSSKEESSPQAQTPCTELRRSNRIRNPVCKYGRPVYFD